MLKVLERRGVIDAAAGQVAESVPLQGPPMRVLAGITGLSEAHLADALAAELGLIRVDLSSETPSAQALAAVPQRLAEKHLVLPIQVDSGTVTLAVADPFDFEGADEVRLLTGLAVRTALAEVGQIEAAIKRCYQHDAGAVASAIYDLSDVDLRLLARGVEEEVRDLASPESGANEAPIIRLVDAILLQAVREGATDVHIEPFEDEVRVRYRIDGLLYDVTQPPKRLYPAVISRVKLMAGMDIAEKRTPQDGRIRIRISGQDLDLRVAVAPTVHGESAALRILNRAAMLLDLSHLGLSDETMGRFTRLLQKANGAVLVTGPTGSGKTTTLYAVLSRLNVPERKIITIEDPVEYQLKGVNQMQVNPKVNFTFANGLRSIVRHDPDIILVGEIRDLETAEIAIQAALTGHLVFSTLHTNDAAGAMTRLLDMGAEEFLVASTVRGVLAQRLVRVICPHCKEACDPPADELQRLGMDAGRVTLYHGVGCEHCRGTGYRGQTGIFELLEVTPEIEALILQRTSSTIIRETAVRQGMTLLREDGLRKAAAGITTLSEVLRVTQD